AAAHVLVLDPATRGLWMAMPFSAVPTSFRVTTPSGEWWANCASDALVFSGLGLTDRFWRLPSPASPADS
ncbi:MAG: organomercurial lyase, partial [Gemmatimonadales bacterium]